MSCDIFRPKSRDCTFFGKGVIAVLQRGAVRGAKVTAPWSAILTELLSRGPALGLKSALLDWRFHLRLAAARGPCLSHHLFRSRILPGFGCRCQHGVRLPGHPPLHVRRVLLLAAAAAGGEALAVVRVPRVEGRVVLDVDYLFLAQQPTSPKQKIKCPILHPTSSPSPSPPLPPYDFKRRADQVFLLGLHGCSRAHTTMWNVETSARTPGK